MVVGDDDVHAEAVGVRHFLDAADAAVDRNQQRGLGGDAGDGVQVEAIALIDAVRDVGTHGAAGGLQRHDQQRRRADAVDVKVAVDADRFAAADGAQDALHGRRHVGQLIGVDGGDIGAVEKGVDFGGGAQTAVVEHLRQQRVLVHGLQEACRCGWGDVPFLLQRMHRTRSIARPADSFRTWQAQRGGDSRQVPRNPVSWYSV